MTKRPIKNVAASVHQRLLDVAKRTGRRFNDLVQHYALERWLFRLSRSDYGERFVLKGALCSWFGKRRLPARLAISTCSAG